MPLREVTGGGGGGGGRRVFLGFVVVYLLAFVVVVDGDVHLWPMPASVSRGSRTLYLSSDLALKTDGSKFSDGSGILKDGFERMVELVRESRSVEGQVNGSDNLLAGLHVVVSSSNDSVILSPFLSISMCK